MNLRYCVAVLFVLTLTGCKSSESGTANPGTTGSSSPIAGSSPLTAAAPAAPAVKTTVDVCALLTSDDLKGVQGEAYKEAQRSDRQEGDFVVAQCYYSLPTTVNSVVLNVTVAKEAGAGANPRQFWEQTFEKYEKEGSGEKEREREKEREKEREQQRSKQAKPGARVENEEEEGVKPEKIAGLGEEAFWMASRVGGALYVLKGDKFFRLSVGGAGDAKAKLNKSKTLAQQVLKKL